MIDTASLWICPQCRGVFRPAGARWHRKYENERADVERTAKRRARHRANQRRYSQRHPERVSKSQRTSRARVQADPERRAQKVVNDRINYRLRAEREGREVKRGAAGHGGYKRPTAKGEHFDPEPLRTWLHERFKGAEPYEIANACHVSARVIFAVTHDDWVSLHTADSVLTGYGRPDLLNVLYPMP